MTSGKEKYSRAKKPGKETAANRLFSVYKKTAERKNLSFKLDYFEFFKLVTDRCKYCGIEPQGIQNPGHGEDLERQFIYNGIDRVDSSKGYLSDNVVTCCSTCNYAKRTMSVEQFFNWINRVYKYSISSISEKTPGMLFDELITTDIKCFMAQEDIMNPDLSADVQSDAAHRAQELNARRNKLVRALDSYFNLEDNSHTSKTYYTYFEKGKKE